MKFGGPVMCHTVSCPRSSRCCGGADRAGDLVDRDHRHALLGARLDRHQRHVGVRVQQRVAGLAVRRDHEDAVDALPAQALDRVGHRRAVERLEARDDDEVAGLVRGPLDPEQRRRRAVQRGVEADHAERLRAAGDERPRHRVRPVPELLHRREHALARLGPDVRAAVDDPRHRLVRDAGKAPYVRHDRRAGPPAGDRDVLAWLHRNSDSSPGSIPPGFSSPTRRC